MFVYRPIHQNATSVTCHQRNATKKKCTAKKGMVTEYVTAFHFCCCCFCCCCYYYWLPFTSRGVAVKSTSHLSIWYWEESRLKTWWLYKNKGYEMSFAPITYVVKKQSWTCDSVIKLHVIFERFIQTNECDHMSLGCDKDLVYMMYMS